MWSKNPRPDEMWDFLTTVGPPSPSPASGLALSQQETWDRMNGLEMGGAGNTVMVVET